MASYTDIFGGTVVQTADVSYLALTLNVANTVLSWPVQFQDVNNVVSHIIDVTPTGGGQTVTLPDATQVSVGQDILINNPTATQFSLDRNNGTLLSNVAGGNIIYFYLIDNTTTAGTWRAIPFGGGVAAVTSIDADVPDATDAANMAIAGGPITAAGILHFSFQGDISALIGFGGGTGISVRTAVNTWALRQIQPVTNGNLVVNNPDGVAGNITIDLAQNVGIAPSNPVTSLRVGNITLSGLNIITNFMNGNLNLMPNGTGEVVTPNNLSITTGGLLKFSNAANDQTLSFSGSELEESIDLTWPARNPIAGQVLQFVGPNELGWTAVASVFGGVSTDNAIAKFRGGGGQLQNSAVFIDVGNNITTGGNVTANSYIAGTITIGATNVISTSAGNITMAPVPGSVLQINSNISLGNILNSYSLLFNSGAFNVSFSVPVLTGNVPLVLPAAPGVANSLLVNDGAGNLSFTNTATTGTSGLVASSADTLAATNPTRPVVPLYMKAHPGVSKANGIIRGADGVLLYGYNIANVTRYGAGQYRVEFALNFSSANYTVVLSAESGGLSYQTVYANIAVDRVNLVVYEAAGGTPTDPVSLSFACYGTQ